VRKREAEAKASARPSFVSKKDREAAALKRREEEVAARRNRGSGTDTRAPPFEKSRSFPFRETHDDRGFDHRRDGDAFDETRARERELELIRAQYMGGAKAKKKVTKPGD
jgi:ATP-dependent RNA helicase DDX23/PRP28